jgi:hypothetical protein
MHFSNEDNPIYQELAKVLESCRQNIVLPYDRQCLQPISATAGVTIDNKLHQGGEILRCIYLADPLQVGYLMMVEVRSGKSVLLTVPATGCVIF